MKKPDVTKAKVGVKFDQGKLRYDLIPVVPMEEVAKVYTFGASKYADRNWELGMPYNRIYGAVQRHLTAYWKGESRNAQDGGTHHLAQAVFGCLALMEFERTHPELDNRPKK